MYYSLKHRESGFTLIELLIAMAISGIVLAAIVSTFIIQRKSYDVQEQITEMVQGARAAMDMMTREIRMAGYDPTGAIFDGIPYNSNSSIIDIYADLDGNGNTTGTYEHITYLYDGVDRQIDRNTNTGAGDQPFAENIQELTPIFAYLDSAGSPTTSTADIRQIRITITARTAKIDPDYPGGYRTYTLTSLITPPNLAFSF